jgi:hypothetical protein
MTADWHLLEEAVAGCTELSVAVEAERIFERELKRVEEALSTTDNNNSSNNNNSIKSSKAAFIETVSILTQSSVEVDGTIFDVLLSQQQQNVSVENLADFMHRLCWTCFRLQHAETITDWRARWARSMLSSSAVAIVDSCHDGKYYMTKANWLGWIQKTGPAASRAMLPTIFQYVFLRPPPPATANSGETSSSSSSLPTAKSQPGPFRPRMAWVTAPDAHDDDSNTCRGGKEDDQMSASCLWTGAASEPVPMQLALMGLGGPWLSKKRRLYQSTSDGLAFPRFCQALLSYTGPTLLLIQTVSGEVLGYYTTLAWKVGATWYSTESSSAANESDSFLFRLRPLWNVYKLVSSSTASEGHSIASPWSTRRNRYHQYLYAPLSHRQGSALSGLAVGGIGVDTPRLHLTTSFERCKAVLTDATFTPGPLLKDDDSIFFDVDVLELWAAGSGRAFQQGQAAGQRNASVREATRIGAAQVGRHHFVNDFASGAYMNNLYQHRETIRGRASFSAHDEVETKGYYIDHESNDRCG